MHIMTDDEIMELEQDLESTLTVHGLYELEVTTDYSGRAMYGAQCFSVEGPMYELDEGKPILMELMGDEPRIDNMGMDYVYYWPNLRTRDSDWGI